MGELLTLEEVANRLKIKAETVRRLWVKTGKLPAVKLGRRWRIDADDLHLILQRESPKDVFTQAINEAIAPMGLCTRASEQDQLYYETEGREFKPRPPID